MFVKLVSVDIDKSELKVESLPLPSPIHVHPPGNYNPRPKDVAPHKPVEYMVKTTNLTKIHWHLPPPNPLNPPLERPKEGRLPNEGNQSLNLKQLQNYVAKKQTLVLNVFYLKQDVIDKTKPIEATEVEVMGLNHHPIKDVDR